MPAASIPKRRALPTSDGERSIEPLNDGTVDGKTRTAECFTTRARDEFVLHESENLELLAHLTPEPLVDGIGGPFEQLGIPVRAVIERDGWNPTQDVVRPEAVRQ